MAKTWRLRRCPGCAEVQAAGDLLFADRAGVKPWQGGTVLRRCPLCGFTGETGEFAVVTPVHQTEGARRQKAYFAMIERIGIPFSLADYRTALMNGEVA